MSNAASWSYTSSATHWAKTGRSDWTGARTWSAPVVFACDYKRGDAAEGTPDRERVPSLTAYTERPGIKPGDMLLIGESAAADPIAAGAVEVSAVTMFPDTIEGGLPDYRVEV